MKAKYYFLVLFSIVAFTMHAQDKKDGNAVLQSVDRHFFIENKGQWDGDVLYLCRLGGFDAWITKYGVAYNFYKIKNENYFY
jgi:hypothetical protein